MFLPTFPYLEVDLFTELQNRGLEVIYVLREGDYRLVNGELSNIFANMPTMTIKHKPDILSIMEKGDLFVLGYAQKPGEWDFDVSKIVRKAGFKVFMHDVAGFDICKRDTWAHYISVKSEYMKEEIERHGRTKKFEKIFVTGTVHHDAAWETRLLNRDWFWEQYGLDPAKKVALLTPANPDEMFIHDNVMGDYQTIIKTIQTQCPDYQLIMKCHPFDYTEKLPDVPGIKKKKSTHNWEVNAPGVPIVKAEEGYQAVRSADVIISVVSSLAMEICLFEKPLLLVNSKKHRNEWPKSESYMKHIQPNQLADTLNNNDYGVDKKACTEFCNYVAHSRDGQAYVRIANAIEEVL